MHARFVRKGVPDNGYRLEGGHWAIVFSQQPLFKQARRWATAPAPPNSSRPPSKSPPAKPPLLLLSSFPGSAESLPSPSLPTTHPGASPPIPGPETSPTPRQPKPLSRHTESSSPHSRSPQTSFHWVTPRRYLSRQSARPNASGPSRESLRWDGGGAIFPSPPRSTPAFHVPGPVQARETVEEKPGPASLYGCSLSFHNYLTQILGNFPNGVGADWVDQMSRFLKGELNTCQGQGVIRQHKVPVPDSAIQLCDERKGKGNRSCFTLSVPRRGRKVAGHFR